MEIPGNAKVRKITGRVWQELMHLKEFDNTKCKCLHQRPASLFLLKKKTQISSPKLSLHPHLPKLCSQGSIVFLSWKPGSAGKDGCHHSISKKQKISKHIWAGDGITLLMWSAPASVNFFMYLFLFYQKLRNTSFPRHIFRHWSQLQSLILMIWWIFCLKMVQCLAGPFFQAWLGQARDSDAGIFVYLFSFLCGGNPCIRAITVVVRSRYQQKNN